MNKMKKILKLFGLAIAFSLAICSCKAHLDTPNYVTVSFDSNTGTGTMEPQVFEENVPQALSENKFTKDGCTFAGWATKADASEAEYADKANFTATKDITLYAIWSVIPPTPKQKYTITYASTYGTKPANKEVEEGYQLTAADLPDLGETDDKYFDKWDKTAGTEITADTTITAVWEPIVYFDKSKITSYNSSAEKIIFTTDSYTGTGTTFDCASGSNSAYFTGVLDGTTLTIYGNGHRIYAPKNCQGFFSGFSKVTNIELNNLYTSKVTNMQQMFNGCNLLASLDLSSFDTSAVTNMMAMFSNCEVLTSPDLSSFNTSSVTNMAGMFMSCKAFTSLDLSSFNTSNVINMQNMFLSCINLSSLNISSFTTSSVTNMANMFNGCGALKSLNLSKFDTSSVNQMTGMFSSCYELEELDLSNFDTSSVTKMDSMFKCTGSTNSKLKKIIFSNKFTTAEVTIMSSMFYNCCSLTSLDLSSFSSEGLTLENGTNKILSGSVLGIFDGCSSLTTIYATSEFDLSNTQDDVDNIYIFSGDTKLVGGEGTKYSDCENSDPDNYKLPKYAHIDGGTSNPGYFTEKK